jgi:hypothetical protein
MSARPWRGGCGHPRTPENTKPGYGGRGDQCRECHRVARRRSDLRRLNTAAGYARWLAYQRRRNGVENEQFSGKATALAFEEQGVDPAAIARLGGRGTG